MTSPSKDLNIAKRLRSIPHAIKTWKQRHRGNENPEQRAETESHPTSCGHSTEGETEDYRIVGDHTYPKRAKVQKSSADPKPMNIMTLQEARDFIMSLRSPGIVATIQEFNAPSMLMEEYRLTHPAEYRIIQTVSRIHKVLNSSKLCMNAWDRDCYFSDVSCLANYLQEHGGRCSLGVIGELMNELKATKVLPLSLDTPYVWGRSDRPDYCCRWCTFLLLVIVLVLCLTLIGSGNKDECDITTCHNGTCNDLSGPYECQCDPGFDGQHCEIDIDECESSPCLHGATCQDQMNGYECNCSPGYRGIVCNITINIESFDGESTHT